MHNCGRQFSGSASDVAYQLGQDTNTAMGPFWTKPDRNPSFDLFTPPAPPVPPPPTGHLRVGTCPLLRT